MAFGNLILHDRVHLDVGHLDSRNAMVFFRQSDSLLLIKCKPLRSFRCSLWIVTMHDLYHWLMWL